MAEPKRYEEYPEIARSVRAMTPEIRQVVAHWHRVLTTALEGYIPKVLNDLSAPLTGRDLTVGRTSADMALTEWLRVMRGVAAIIADPSEGDWCCKRGMISHPAPCPQHDYDPRVLYDVGTIMERVAPEYFGFGDVERAVCVEAPSGIAWMSVQRGEFIVPDLDEHWKKVGRV